jgi:hypothetical protein
VIRLLLSVVALAGLTGCLPTWPIVTPGVSGHLTQNGVPVAGVKIYIVDRLRNENCGASSLEATTDQGGAFAIDSTSSFEWNMPGDRLVSWSLCVNYEGEWITAHKEGHIGYPRPKVLLECDLSAPVEKRSDPVYTEGLCCERDA